MMTDVEEIPYSDVASFDAFIQTFSMTKLGDLYVGIIVPMSDKYAAMPITDMPGMMLHYVVQQREYPPPEVTPETVDADKDKNPNSVYYMRDKSQWRLSDEPLHRKADCVENVWGLVPKLKGLDNAG
jgi:hypothetical protein